MNQLIITVSQMSMEYSEHETIIALTTARTAQEVKDSLLTAMVSYIERLMPLNQALMTASNELIEHALYEEEETSYGKAVMEASEKKEAFEAENNFFMEEQYKINFEPFLHNDEQINPFEVFTLQEWFDKKQALATT